MDRANIGRDKNRPQLTRWRVITNATKQHDIHLSERKMLKGIPAAVSPELMIVLMQMGHGDRIVLADGNFPADSNAQRIVRADGHDLITVLDSVLKFLPIDTYVDDPVQVMQPVDDSIPEPPIWSRFRESLQTSEGREIALTQIERFEFYERARDAYAIVATSETALYANIILSKGVVID